MKKTDIAMILFIVIISVTISAVVANSFFGENYKGNAKVQTIDKIESTVDKPNPDIFNKEAINPAIKVEINQTDSGTANAVAQ